MPDFKVLCQRFDGQKGTRVVTADNAQDAAAQVVKQGLKALRVEKIEVKVRAAARASSPDRGQGWSDFWRFRLMVTPTLVRWNFIIATLLCAGYFCTLPFQYMTERSEAVERLAPNNARIAEYQDYLDEFARIETQIAQADQEAEQYRDQPEEGIAARDASARARELSNRLPELNDRAGFHGPEEVRQRLAREEERIAELQLDLPELTPFIMQMVAIPFAWLGIRLVFEEFVVLFSIHDRLVELADA